VALVAPARVRAPAVGRPREAAWAQLRPRLSGMVGALPLLLVGVAVVVLFGWLGRWLARLEWPYRRIDNLFLRRSTRQLVAIALTLVGALLALEILDATALVAALLGTAGLFGLVLGLAFRELAENGIASLLLSLRQPFAPNDLVEIEGELGRVIRLTSRSTILLSLDGNHVRLPNSVVFKSKIVNFTREPQRRFTFDLGVDPDSDLTAARQTGLDAMRRIAFVLDDPPAMAWVEDVGDSNVVLRFAGWVDQKANDFQLARGEAIRVTKTALETAGFALPEPIYRLRFDRRGATSEPAKEPSSRPESRGAAAPPDATIERKVEADRRETAATDLLRHGGRQE
jgi:small-conductance mechanosensitive channel